MPEDQGSMPRRRTPLPAAGFTLLEMLVVLSLLALAVGITAPRAVSWLDAARERGWRDDLRAYLESIPVRAFLSGEGRSYVSGDLLKSVPGAPDVEVRLPEPLVYDERGVASGGTVEFYRGATKEVWRVEPITGRVFDGR